MLVAATLAFAALLVLHLCNGFDLLGSVAYSSATTKQQFLQQYCNKDKTESVIFSKTNGYFYAQKGITDTSNPPQQTENEDLKATEILLPKR